MNWVGLSVALLGALVAAAGLFRAFWPVAPMPAYRDLDGPARGVLERQVRHELGSPSGDLRLLRTAAEIMVAQRNLLGVWLGCFLIQFGTALADWNSAHLLVTVLFGLGVGGLTLYFERRAEAGAVFLARHPGRSLLETGRLNELPAEPRDQAPAESADQAEASVKAAVKGEADAD